LGGWRLGRFIPPAILLLTLGLLAGLLGVGQIEAGLKPLTLIVTLVLFAVGLIAGWAYLTDRKKVETALALSEQRLRLALDAANQGWFDVDLRSGKVTISPEYARIIGYDPDGFEADVPNWLAHIHPEDRDGATAVFRACIENGGPGTTEFRRQTRSGDWKWIHSIGKIVEWDADHRATRMIGVHTDITERKQAELALKKSEERSRLAQEAAHVGVWEWDIVNKRNYWSPEARKLYGATDDEVPSNEGWRRRVNPEDVPLIDAAWNALREQKEFEVELRLILDSGETRWLLTKGSAEYDASGNVSKLIGVNLDITERKKTEEYISNTNSMLVEQAKHLKNVNAELEQFAYVASHDLRQPLRMVTSYLTLISKQLNSQLSEEQQEYIEFAVNGARRMDALILGLLEYSRCGRQTESFRSVSLADIVAESLLNLNTTVTEAGAKISVAEGLPKIRGDKAELCRLFQNLIGNAIKYQRPDKKPEIEIGFGEKGDRWVVWVQDNGIGIPEGQRERAFRIFQRLVPKGSYEGTGIGLAICKKIVEHHGGRIWIEDATGGGSIFLMELPNTAPV